MVGGKALLRRSARIRQLTGTQITKAKRLARPSPRYLGDRLPSNPERINRLGWHLVHRK
jgi:hypothetical protein